MSPRGPSQPSHPTSHTHPAASGAAKRAKELRDRESYLKNMWYAAGEQPFPPVDWGGVGGRRQGVGARLGWKVEEGLQTMGPASP